MKFFNRQQKKKNIVHKSQSDFDDNAQRDSQTPDFVPYDSDSKVIHKEKSSLNNLSSSSKSDESTITQLVDLLVPVYLLL